MMSNLQLDHAAFEMWLTSEGEDTRVDLEKAKRFLPIVLNECVTPKQRDYILLYFVDQKTMKEIGQIYGVDRSTVSRVIRRGIDKAYGYLRFVSPLFMKPVKRRNYLTNHRSRKTVLAAIEKQRDPEYQNNE